MLLLGLKEGLAKLQVEVPSGSRAGGGLAVLKLTPKATQADMS